MTSDGYICSAEDLALSRNSTVPLLYCLTRGQSFGLLLNAESAFISLVAVIVVFALLLRRYCGSAHWVQSSVELYMLSLFVADFIQAAGMAMDIKWIHEGKVQTGTYCTVQGALHQLGETAVAMSALVIAIHTFTVVWGRRRPEHPRHPSKAAYTLVLCIWLFIILFVAIGIKVHTHDDNFYETPTPYWCWIGKQYTLERIFGQYFWLWLTLLVSILSYIPLFFFARGCVTIDPQRWWKSKFHKQIDRQAQDQDQDRQRRRRALKLIAYPLVYSILVLPLSIVRWISFSGRNETPSVATFIVINIYALSGAFNVLLLLMTRSDLFLFRERNVNLGPAAAGSSTDTSTQGALPSDKGHLAPVGVGWSLDGV